jgi:transposase
MVYTDEYDIYSRLVEWGYQHKSVNHSAGEYARDEALP